MCLIEWIGDPGELTSLGEWNNKKRPGDPIVEMEW